MVAHRKRELWLAASCLASALLAWGRLETLEASEFSGGRVTGTLLALFDGGMGLFVLAILLAFAYRRVAAGIALLSSLLSLPLYLYFVVPSAFRIVFGGEYSVTQRTGIVRDYWAIAGILAVALVVGVCLRNFAIRRPPTVSNH